MNKVRGFEIINEYKDIVNDEFIPQRGTRKSAGYDLKSAQDITIPTVWSQLIEFTKGLLFSSSNADDKKFRATMIPTGLTAYFQDNEVLKIHVRSSIGFKQLMTLANNVGIIDADYYDKGGHIMIPMINFGFKDRFIKKGDAVAQGIFETYLTTDNDKPISEERVGGFGSTNTVK